MKRWLGFFLLLPVLTAQADEQATALVKAAIDYWRDESSYSVVEMVIHRPDWQRAFTLRVWTKGDKDALVRVIAPPKDEGSGTLLKDNEMWSFTPKINRIVKIPSSMMGQSWMGSDFSNNDISKADKIVNDYVHTILGSETHEGQSLTIIEAKPKEHAPVVWGREVVKIRADYLVLEHAFYDQDNKLVKKMLTSEIKEMGGKPIATIQRMQQAEKPDEWTEIRVKEAEFRLAVSDSTFTLSSLRNPRF